MRNRVERLRIGLLGSAVFLVVMIAAFIGSARYLRRHYLAGLPARLGLNVVREANGYTLSQTVKGRTLYRLHAAKAIEHANGKIALHDVSITLYGKQGERSDRIYGDEFEYDKNADVVRATGVVHIDLESAETAGRADKGGSSAKVTHVTTSGLVYLRKLGVAATSEAIEFESGGMTGHAVGADYSSDSGLLVLHSAVRMNGKSGGRAVAMTAATAQFDEGSRQGVLTQATYESEGRRVAADEATLDSRADGTLSGIRAKGDVRVAAKGAEVTSERADIAMAADGQPQTAVLSGAVKYVADGSLRQMRGGADEVTIAFDGEKKSQPEHALFVGVVRMTEKTRTSVAAAWSVRDLTAAKVEAWLVPGAAGKTQVRDVEAMGSPRLSVVEDAVGGANDTELAADDLKAHLVDTGDVKRPMRVDTIVGRGRTLLRQTTAEGTEQTTAADTLDVKLRPAPVVRATKTSATAGVDKLAESLWSSVQQGHVQMMRRVPAKAGAAGGAARSNAGVEVQHAFADRAVYDGDLDRMTLSGGVQVTDASSALWADQYALDHKTGDAHATGGVKVSYVGDGPPMGGMRSSVTPAEPTHVLADRADMVHASGIATFYGRPVRMWQGGNQIQAAVIELSNTEKRLVARGDGMLRGANSEQVLMVLAGSGEKASGGRGAGVGTSGCVSSAAGKTTSGAAAMDASSAGVTRIASGGLTYSATTRELDFTGGLRAETSDGTIRAGQGTAYLRKANASSADAAATASATASSALSGDLDRVVMTGSVELDRPGLKAFGKRLVYTANDRSAVLTGDEKNLPRAVEAQGTTTGAALRFRSSCDGRGGGSVEVLGTMGQRVHTDATVSNGRKNEKGK